MTNFVRKSLVIVAVLAMSACATSKGAVIGGGIGALAGDAGKGAAIGASVGAVVDIVD